MGALRGSWLGGAGLTYIDGLGRPGIWEFDIYISSARGLVLGLPSCVDLFFFFVAVKSVSRGDIHTYIRTYF